MTIFESALHAWKPYVFSVILVIIHTLVQASIALRVIMSRRSVGASLAWITIVFMLPIAGPCIYLLIGELRLGSRRARLVRQLAEPMQLRYKPLEDPRYSARWGEIGEDWEQLSVAGQRMLQVPTLSGNRLELIESWEQVFDRMIVDIESATINCDMEFYIWQCGGRADELASALERALLRGVACRILVDALGSRAFLRSEQADRLKKAGAQIQAALPGGLWRLPFIRFDLRLHRKIVLIDDQIAWTGSLNMVDPRYFHKSAGVGQWVDAMVRMEGPSVEALAITFQSDWYVESEHDLASLPDLTGDQRISKKGECAVQVLPSGPANRVEAIERVLITAIYAAREELVLTTPYFVPSEALQMALSSAAQRGVKVILVLPKKVDSQLVQLASGAFKGELLDAGVHVVHFHRGLLHTKSVTIDRKTSLFGSLNMDARSFQLNFEITLVIYDQTFTKELRQLQQSYIDQSEMMDASSWHRRPITHRFAENIARLWSPLL
jgi:cardiolipin synthase